MARSRSSTAVIHDELGLGLVVYSQYAFDFCAVSYAPNCVMSQLRMVAAVAGRTRRKDLLNELTAKFESAGSILPALASLTGFSELTNPESIMNSATQAAPCPTSRKIGRCISNMGAPLPWQGITIHRAKAIVRWLNMTNTAAMPRRPCFKSVIRIRQSRKGGEIHQPS